MFCQLVAHSYGMANPYWIKIRDYVTWEGGIQIAIEWFKLSISRPHIGNQNIPPMGSVWET